MPVPGGLEGITEACPGGVRIVYNQSNICFDLL